LRGKGRWGSFVLYSASAQIWMVSAKGTFMKRLAMSYEQKKSEEGFRVELFIFSAKVKES